MKNRVGISSVGITDRQIHLKQQFPSLNNWGTVAEGLSYEQAKEKEDHYINSLCHERCPSSEDGGGANYCVYTYTD